ncbi:MAG: GH3 auxin-responsive promoter family protein [Dehalococcoidales bacterium]|nr:GH3 auxin-responsive promoter family protein [Dehalococcoidales bacterium]
MKYPIVKSGSDRAWLKYCGFLDLSVDQFISIQESLLMQQIEKVSLCKLGQKIMGRNIPRNVKEFRRFVPLTRYEDYLPELDMCDESALVEKPYTWAHTSGGSIAYRKVPIMNEVRQKQLDHLMAAFILACSRCKGQSSVAEGDRVLFNVAPKPYLSGVLATGASETFNMHPVIDPHDHDRLEFREKMTRGFEQSLRTGMDILVAMTGVLVKTGNEFDQRSHKSSLSGHLLHPGELYRLTRAYLTSKLENRSILPKDIWPLKALICWGIDTQAYSEQVYKFWGAYPYQFHACTEGGIMALQSWNRRAMTFIPNSNFYEFIPEAEWEKSRNDLFYQPKTLTLSEVQAGESYELVITSFYGGPFIRYRLGHLITITDLEDSEAEICLPQMIFESRADDLIDIAGFTRVCEKSISAAIANSGIVCEDWLARKETVQGKPTLHLYIEITRNDRQEDISEMLHNELVEVDAGYRDLSLMMEIYPLQVTLLKPGSFNSYARSRRNAGFELAQQKPSRMNATKEDILELMGFEAMNIVKAG